jgi:hypothetical protein
MGLMIIATVIGSAAAVVGATVDILNWIKRR